MKGNIRIHLLAMEVLNKNESFLNEMSGEEKENIEGPQSVIKIGKIDHHSCDVDWTGIDEFGDVLYDPTVCFTLEKKWQSKAGSENVLKIYTGYAKKFKIAKLDSGKCYQFRLKQLNGKELSDWITVITNSTPTSINDIVKLVKREKTEELSRLLKNESKAGSTGTLNSLDSVNDNQISPLMQAASSNWLKGAEILLDINNDRDRSLGHIPAASANYLDPVNNRSALMIACRNGALKVIELLCIDTFASWNFADISGLYALHWVVDPKSASTGLDYASVILDWIKQNEEELVNFDWGVRDRYDNWTTLHRACARGASAKTVIKLIDLGGLDVHEQENKGQTPLMLAVLYGHYEIVGALLKRYGKELADSKSRKEPYRSARDLIHSSTANRRALKEIFDKYT